MIGSYIITRLDPLGVSNLPHVLTITNKSSTFQDIYSQEELSVRITDVLTKFQSLSG